MTKKCDIDLIDTIVSQLLKAEKNQNVAIKWLDVAKSDFCVSSLLFNEGFFPQSIYFLQQANEKMI